MGYKIADIEGIGAKYRAKLEKAGIKNTDQLLDACASPRGRKSVAEETGLSGKLILGWTNMADLMRVSGIGRQYAELLEASGVNTIKQLRSRNAESLAKKAGEVNAKKKLARTSPSASMVQRWIDQAKDTEPKMTY